MSTNTQSVYKPDDLTRSTQKSRDKHYFAYD